MTILQTQRVSLIVTKACTLKCKLCGAIAPYIGGRYNPSAVFLKKELDAFFTIVDQTGIVDISGGEPLLRSGRSRVLAEILLYLVNTYPKEFERVRLFTNGTIVPNNELCQIFQFISKRKSFNIVVDHYGKHSPRVREISEKLGSYNIAFTVRDYMDNMHCGGWVDLRDMSECNTEAEAQVLFKKCAIPQKLGCCFELMDGIMSPCSLAASRYLCGLSSKDSTDIIDLFDDPLAMRNKLMRILNAPVFESCKFCNGGLTDDSPRFIPAEQATQAEIDGWNKKYKMTV